MDGVLVRVTTAVPLQAARIKANTTHEARNLATINPGMRVLFSHSRYEKSFNHEKICEVPLM